MRFWKKNDDPARRSSLPESTLRGATHEELVQQAVVELVRTGTGDRFGVWLEMATPSAADQTGALHGVTWDREDEDPPREWNSLEPQRVLPAARLVAGAVLESQLGNKSAEPMMGPLVGLQKAVWVPIEHAGKLRGILMGGAIRANASLPIEQLKTVAAKLAVALAFESEHKLATERYTDLALCNKVLGNIDDATGLDRLLREVVESCVVQQGGFENPNAIAAALLQVPGEADVRKADRIELKLLHAAGQEGARATFESETVHELGRLALRTERTSGDAVTRGSTGETPLRVVAVPIFRRGRTEAVMLAAFPSVGASLSTLERIELRARLAGHVLAALWQRGEKKREERQEEALLEANNAATVVLDQRGKVIAANRSARTLLQLGDPTRDEVKSTGTAFSIGRDFSEYFSEPDREAVLLWQRGSREARSEREITEVALECGARVTLRQRFADEDCQTVTLVPLKHMRLEKDGRAAAELLSLAEWLDQGVVIYDAQDNIRLVNLRFAQLTGMAPDTVPTLTTLDQLIDRLQSQSAEPETFAQHWKQLANRLEGGEREEIHLMRPIARVLERASRPVLDEKGGKIGRIELYKDLTAQRVFHAKLLQTERMAALGQMVSGVAHELSNPLTSILGYAQRLLVRSDGDEHFEEVRKIFAEAERAGAILRRMLLAARETAPERRPVDLNQLVQRTIELQRFSLAAERIRVELSLDALLPNVLGDAGQLQQVLINLMGNARQAIESQGNGGTIRIRTERGQDRRVRLEVSDSGPGIPESILARIFDPFFTTKPAGVGTGLGLSIVLSLVREHGGKVDVASPRGGGATFMVELPSAEQQELPNVMTVRRPDLQTAAGKGEVLSAAARQVSALRVAVVEDEVTVAQLISDVLHDEGFEVETILDGRDVKDRILRGQFDLIVCDMRMPNLDGQSLYDSLGPERELLRQKFLFVTGDVLGAKTQSFLARNKIPHVAKPFRVEELLEKVHQVLHPAGSAGPQRVSPIRKNSATTG